MIQPKQFRVSSIFFFINQMTSRAELKFAHGQRSKGDNRTKIKPSSTRTPKVKEPSVVTSNTIDTPNEFEIVQTRKPPNLYDDLSNSFHNVPEVSHPISTPHAVVTSTTTDENIESNDITDENVITLDHCIYNTKSIIYACYHCLIIVLLIMILIAIWFRN